MSIELSPMVLRYSDEPPDANARKAELVIRGGYLGNPLLQTRMGPPITSDSAGTIYVSYLQESLNTLYDANRVLLLCYNDLRADTSISTPSANVLLKLHVPDDYLSKQILVLWDVEGFTTGVDTFVGADHFNTIPVTNRRLIPVLTDALPDMEFRIRPVVPRSALYFYKAVIRFI